MRQVQVQIFSKSVAEKSHDFLATYNVMKEFMKKDSLALMQSFLQTTCVTDGIRHNVTFQREN
jgi:hypothetical protein